ncbi:hypothetical protein SAMN05421868_14329 [Paenibacillus naphthalenovorans]|nr:hypothetical protein SAMN05421868_14329 [Paenibacillus naphthalenovorans]
MSKNSKEQENKIGGFDDRPLNLDFDKQGEEFVQDFIRKVFDEDEEQEKKA